MSPSRRRAPACRPPVSTRCANSKKRRSGYEPKRRLRAPRRWPKPNAWAEREAAAMSALATPAEAASDRIPVLDIGPFLAGEPGAAAPLARAIARTCEDTGFL